MALITELFESKTGNQRLHSSVQAGWSIFEVGERNILQLDTYDSVNRKIPGKVSQTLQIDQLIAEELMDLLRKAFPTLA